MGAQKTGGRGTWAKLSGRLWLNGKWRRFAASDPAAAVLWVNAISYCADQLTDGHVDAYVATGLLGGSDREIASLVDAGLADDDGRGGFTVHDYTDWQITAEQMSDLTEKRRRAAEARWSKEKAKEKKRGADGDDS